MNIIIYIVITVLCEYYRTFIQSYSLKIVIFINNSSLGSCSSSSWQQMLSAYLQFTSTVHIYVCSLIASFLRSVSNYKFGQSPLSVGNFSLVISYDWLFKPLLSGRFKLMFGFTPISIGFLLLFCLLHLALRSILFPPYFI